MVCGPMYWKLDFLGLVEFEASFAQFETFLIPMKSTFNSYFRNF